MEPGSLLHVGCGSDPLPEWLGKYKEVRLDIDQSCNPDIVADMLNLGEIGKFDVVFSQHNLEHIHQHEVQTALKEFHRVLNDNGALIVFVPDCENVKPTEEILFDSPAGGISGLDLLYGYRKVLKEKPYMAHKNAFTKDSLHAALSEAGFNNIKIQQLHPYNMMGVGTK
ncbi:methyltransferase domain [Caudoviricetes sp.]|nr:methyltransferase domain [Caudoviricetes sp.]